MKVLSAIVQKVLSGVTFLLAFIYECFVFWNPNRMEENESSDLIHNHEIFVTFPYNCTFIFVASPKDYSFAIATSQTTNYRLDNWILVKHV